MKILSRFFFGLAPHRPPLCDREAAPRAPDPTANSREQMDLGEGGGSLQCVLAAKSPMRSSAVAYVKFGHPSLIAEASAMCIA